MKNANHKTEVLIVGGGLAGLTLATALGQAGVECVCLDREAPNTQLNEAYDGRTTALSFATHNILNACGVWGLIEKDCSPIRDIRVTDGTAPVHLDFPFGEVNGQPFGWIIENRLLRAALLTRVKQLKSVTHIAPATVTALEFGKESVTVILAANPERAKSSEEAMPATTRLRQNNKIKANLIIGADGKDSFCRKAAGIAVRERPYKQTALVCTLFHSRPHNGLALENFRPSGPFAVLPMTKNRVSIVWSEKESLAPHFLKLSDDEFLEELRLRIGDWLGEIKLASKRFAYPLALLHAAKYTAPRLALINEAAHRMHPIAGQGLNVGMRDVALLAELIVDARREGRDVGSNELLEDYEKGRKGDTLAMLAGTNVLTHLFSNDLPALTLARRAGLGIVQNSRPLKGFFMRYAMGLIGPRSRLISGSRL